MSAIGGLWSRGCLGKALVVFLVLVVVGACNSALGLGRQAPTAAPTSAPLVVATATAQATEAPRATRVRAPTTAPVAPQAPILPHAKATATPEPTEAPTSTPEPAIAPTEAPQPQVAPAQPEPASFDRNGDGKVTCADFDTRAEAQRALDAGYTKLDNDHDGVPCESLP